MYVAVPLLLMCSWDLLTRIMKGVIFITSLFLFVIMAAVSGLQRSTGSRDLLSFGSYRGQSEAWCSIATGGASATDLLSMAKGAYTIAAWSASGFAGPGLGLMFAPLAVAGSTWC